MSIDRSAVLLYGFNISYPEAWEDDTWQTHTWRVIKGLGFNVEQLGEGDGVDFTEVGPWDRDRLYLHTALYSAEEGLVGTVAIGFDAETYARWDGMLNAVARKLGILEHPTPEWTLMVDQA